MDHGVEMQESACLLVIKRYNIFTPYLAAIGLSLLLTNLQHSEECRLSILRIYGASIELNPAFDVHMIHSKLPLDVSFPSFRLFDIHLAHIQFELGPRNSLL